MTAIELITELAKFPPHMEVERHVSDCVDEEEYYSSQSINFVKKETDEDGREFILIV